MPSPAELREELLRKYPKSKLTPATPADIAQVRKEYPGIPQDFVDFLAEVGWGNIGDCNFVIYSGPIAPSDIYDEETAESLDGIILVGDDFSGYCVGYNAKEGWSLGEVSENGRFDPLYKRPKSFAEMIQRRFLSDD